MVSLRGIFFEEIYFCMLKCLNFYNSSFALRYFLNVNSNATHSVTHPLLNMIWTINILLYFMYLCIDIFKERVQCRYIIIIIIIRKFFNSHLFWLTFFNLHIIRRLKKGCEFNQKRCEFKILLLLWWCQRLLCSGKWYILLVWNLQTGNTQVNSTWRTYKFMNSFGVEGAGLCWKEKNSLLCLLNLNCLVFCLFVSFLCLFCLFFVLFFVLCIRLQKHFAASVDLILFTTGGDVCQSWLLQQEPTAEETPSVQQQHSLLPY